MLRSRTSGVIAHMTQHRGRFAPTPSGRMHLGNACTALLAWLSARSKNGTIALRLEDLDRPRCRPEYEQGLIEDLRWLGLDWDEGPDVGGQHAPYRQSEREPVYREAFERLLSKNLVYPCFCSRKDVLQSANAPHGLTSEGPAYPGRCRGLSSAERERLASIRRPSWRFALPDRPVSFRDEVHGFVAFEAGTGGDFIVRRSDGVYAYQLAVVVDDAEMGVTEVWRGSDLLDSTPRQLLLFEALELRPPAYAHAPLWLGPDGRRLSKRHGEEITLQRLRASGIAAERVVGWLAYRCGLIDRPEPAKPRELVERFIPSRVVREPIRLSQRALTALTEGVLTT